MAFPFVQAFHDYGPRQAPTLALVIHMAEGGGTVGFLAKRNPNGVSVHYVIERTGRIVQMLQEARASGSINPRDVRTDDGPPPYGATAALAVLGFWQRDPNEAVLSVEIEGFAADGPNEAQRAALGRLVADVRTRHPRIGLLGHRDFADYKRCPGALIPWADLGGHGPAEEDPMPGLITRPGPGYPVTGTSRIAGDVELIRLHDRARVSDPRSRVRGAVGPVLVKDLDDAVGYLVDFAGATCWVREAQAGFTPTATDCAMAIADQAARVRAAVDRALGG